MLWVAMQTVVHAVGRDANCGSCCGSRCKLCFMLWVAMQTVVHAVGRDANCVSCYGSRCKLWFMLWVAMQTVVHAVGRSRRSLKNVGLEDEHCQLMSQYLWIDIE